MRIRPILMSCIGVLWALSSSAAASDAREIDWVDLMPSHILEKLESLPMLEHDYSEEAVDPFTDDWEDPYADVWNEILNSKEVVERFAGQHVKLPGFIVPLDFDDKQRVTSFFFVPYFGACIHVPPPPPNQLIYVENVPAEKGLSVDDMYAAFWLSGTLKIDTTSHDLGTSAYSMEFSGLEPYSYQW